MTKSNELKNNVNELQQKISDAYAAEEWDKVSSLTNQLNQANIELNAAIACENAEMSKFFNVAAPTTPVAGKNAKMDNRVFNKMLFGRSLTADEQEYVNAVGTPGLVEATSDKGGYLVPEEQIAQLREYRKDYTALKNYCNVITANSTKGSMPTMGDESGVLTNFDEISEINQSDFSFGMLQYSIADYGDIIPVSNQLLQDADINLMDIIGRRLARKAVNTENAEIIKLLKTITPGTVAAYKDVMKALNVDLDPVYFANARIFTNQDGFQWLAELSDNQNRPLLVPDVAAPETYRFRGKQVVVLSNNVLATNTTGKKIPMYIGNMADYVAFFQRLGVEMAVSDQAGFTKYATLIRCVERFGVAKDDQNALKAYNISYS